MATFQDLSSLQLARALSAAPSVGDADDDSQAAVRADHGAAKSLQSIGADTHILVGNAGDNPLIQQLLVQAYQTPVADDFQSRIDEPHCEPTDRLLLQRAGQLIGHVQVSKLIGWFHGQRIGVARLQDFLTLPEYHCQGLDTPLLDVAESVAANEGSLLGFVRTDRPEWFQQRGWSRCRGQGHSRASTHAILSHLDAQMLRRRHAHPPIMVQTWRHFQLDSILQVYQQVAPSMWGTLQRSLENWQWLVGRKAHDQILIALEGTTNSPVATTFNDLTNQPNVIGYAIVRDSCIVEMLTRPGYSAARSALLRQACRDAIDRDHHSVSLHTPAADSLHELLVTAGGNWIADSAATGGEWMLKLLAPDRWAERLYPVLHQRSRDANLQRPLQIDFAVDQDYQRLTLTRRSARLRTINRVSEAVQCDAMTFQDLLTSNLRFPEAIAQGRLRTLYGSTLKILAALFPPKLFSQSPFPLLRL